MNLRSITLKQCATTVMLYGSRGMLRADAALFAHVRFDDLRDYILPSEEVPEVAEAVILLCGEVAAADCLNQMLDVNSDAVVHCLELAIRIQPSKPADLVTKWIECARIALNAHPTIRWAILRLTESLEAANVLSTPQIENILEPFIKFWRGEAPSPVGAIVKTNRVMEEATP